MSKSPVLLSDLLCLTHYKEDESVILRNKRFMWGCTLGLGVIVVALLLILDKH